ncbi:hypothetical protein M595_5125 [Lyngbya aestuarii BL J]|uniref:Uncharacterized protein n=1 Tax=Lyngbya aestuarii BL J TaxID=1348334 RepID=U7QD70_9CYAN|nr:hypothetical protein M595_5125 [Lyngbya aestuarii BL J]
MISNPADWGILLIAPTHNHFTKVDRVIVSGSLLPLTTQYKCDAIVLGCIFLNLSLKS